MPVSVCHHQAVDFTDHLARMVYAMRRFLVALLTIEVAILTLAAANNFPPSEYNALYELYTATDGDNWDWLIVGNHWNFTSTANPCTDDWQGIVCSPPNPTDNFYHVTELQLDSYGLFGTLPAAIGNLTFLETLSLKENRLFSTIPDGPWATMTNLTLINFDENQLTGSIPSSIGSLPRLQKLKLHYNALEGTLPAALCQALTLTELSLYDNALTGTLPSCFSNLVQLTSLYIDTNNLHGTIPTTWDSLTQLLDLELYNNYLTGPFPEFVCSIPGLQSLYLYFNLLTGSVPDCIGGITTLQYLGTDTNQLTGTLPNSLTQITGLLTLWIDKNNLTGTIPDFSAQHSLQELFLNNNQLTGTIPDCFQDMTQAQVVYLGYNHLTGTVPASMGAMATILVLAVNNNMLDGSLPTTFSNLAGLLELYVQKNHFSGTLDGVFDAVTQTKLSDILLNGNRLEGTIPDEVYRLKKLTTFIALGNCFTGTLSEVICSSDSLVSLILDGLHTSSSCRRELLSITHSYDIVNNFHGTIPPCLFNMASLSSLHLSGNGISGSLPDNITIAEYLVDLTVSHNVLTGTIPLAIQTHVWTTLDLSYNKISGELRGDFGKNLEEFVVGNTLYNVSDSAVKLQNNRLSGRIPSALVHLQNVSMLGSNMFSCKSDKSDLPQHDNDRENYQCGSDAFNQPFYVVVSLILLLVLSVGWYYWSPIIRRPIAAAHEVLQKWQLDPQTTPRYLSYVNTMTDILCQIGMICTALAVCILMPWYAAASRLYGTYLRTYAWTVSAAFISGIAPLLTEFVLYCALMITVVVCTVVIVIRKDKEETQLTRTSSHVGQDPVGPSEDNPIPLWQRNLVYVAYALFNLLVVVGVNAGFVAIVLTQNNGVLVFAQIVLSIFKLLWNTVCTPYLIHLATVTSARSSVSLSLVTVQVATALFNNILIPCVVVGVLSSSCFYSVFDVPPPVTSKFVVIGCKAVTPAGQCLAYVPVFLTSSYTPPFRYDYQCSSSLITYYAPAFVYLGLAAGVGAPVAKILAVKMLECAVPGSRWHSFLFAIIPRILKPPVALGTLGSAASSSSAASGRKVMQRPFFDANNLIVSLITYLGILLTFGVVFPPLAVAMCATILSVAWQMKLSAGRYIYNANLANTPSAIDALEYACRGAVSMEKLRRSIFAIICICCCFYSLFLFDTLGDDVGLHKSLWVLFVMPSFPFLIYCAIKVRSLCVKGEDERLLGFSVDEKIVEMKSLPPLTLQRETSASATETEFESSEGMTYNALRVP